MIWNINHENIKFCTDTSFVTCVAQESDGFNSSVEQDFSCSSLPVLKSEALIGNMHPLNKYNCMISTGVHKDSIDSHGNSATGPNDSSVAFHSPNTSSENHRREQKQ